MALLPLNVAVLVITQTVLSVVQIAFVALVAVLLPTAYVGGGALAIFPFIPKLALIASSYRHTEVIAAA